MQSLQQLQLHLALPSAKKIHSPLDDSKMVCMSKTPYCEAIGSLMYAAVTTCPNIACMVSLSFISLSSLKTQEKLTGKPSSDFFIILLALKLTHSHINEHHITYSGLWMLMAHHRDTVMPEAHPKYKVVIHLHSLGIYHSWGEWCILLDPANLTTSSPSKCLGIGSRLI